MSISKRCSDLLEHGAIEDRYDAARFMIMRSVDYRVNVLGHKKREVYASLISEYCLKYNLKKRKLGMYIATGGKV